jgi:hypothetical protein
MGQPGRSDDPLTDDPNGPVTILSPVQVATSTAIDPFLSDPASHIFTMSDAAHVAIYNDGANLVYRVQLPAGSWGAANVLIADDSSRWVQNGNTIYGAATRGGGGVDDTIFKLVYTPGNAILAKTSTTTGGGDNGSIEVVLGFYYDATNGLLHYQGYLNWCCGAAWVGYAYRASDLSFAYSESTGPWSTQYSGQVSVSGMAGDGTGTFFYGGIANGKLSIYRYVAGPTSSTATPELIAPTPVGTVAAGSLVWDGVNIMYLANVGGTKVQVFMRRAQDDWRSYDLTAAINHPSYPAAVLADTPLGYWELGETSGTIAADASGNGRSGTYTGGVTLGGPTSVTAPAAVFDGGSGYVSVSTGAWLPTGSAARSVEVWFNAWAARPIGAYSRTARSGRPVKASACAEV